GGAGAKRRGGLFKVAKPPYRCSRSAPLLIGTFALNRPPQPSLCEGIPALLRRGMAIFGSSGSQTAPAGDSPFRVMVSPSSNTQILLFTEPALRREATSARASLDIG